MSVETSKSIKTDKKGMKERKGNERKRHEDIKVKQIKIKGISFGRMIFNSIDSIGRKDFSHAHDNETTIHFLN